MNTSLIRCLILISNDKLATDFDILFYINIRKGKEGKKKKKKKKKKKEKRETRNEKREKRKEKREKRKEKRNPTTLFHRYISKHDIQSNQDAKI